jgi:4-amino-4-deoxy-L-arabinose transferase-like glycosyltransferase
MLRRLAPVLERRPRLVLVLLCLAFWLPGFFTLPPTDRDESRFTQATKQMLETGDFVRIMNGSVPRNRKPIGIHWLQAPFAAAARQTGMATQNPVWPYRLPSLLGGIAAVLATYSLGLSLFASSRIALLAGAMLAGCVILTVEAHIAKTDAALLGVTTIAMALLGRAFMGRPMSRVVCALFWMAVGAGILIKGPITPMVVGLTALCASGAVRDWRWLGRLRAGWGVALMLAVVLPWCVAIGIATHGAFFADAVGGDLGRKLAGGEDSHGGFPGTHLLLLPLLAFPATLPVLLGLPAAWRRRRERAFVFLLSFIAPAWAVFEAVPTKLPHYTLPLYPGLMLLGAAWLTEAGRPAGRPWVHRGAAALAALAALVVGAGALALPFLLHAPWFLGMPAALCALAAAWCAARAETAAPAVPALVAAGLLYGCVIGLELPNVTALWIAPRVAAALARDWPGDTPSGAGFVAAGYAEPSLMFLAGTRTVFLPNGIGAADFLARAPGDAVLVTGADVPGFLAEAARRHIVPRKAAEIGGFNYSRGVAASLSLFVLGSAAPMGRASPP